MKHPRLRLLLKVLTELCMGFERKAPRSRLGRDKSSDEISDTSSDEISDTSSNNSSGVK